VVSFCKTGPKWRIESVRPIRRQKIRRRRIPLLLQLIRQKQMLRSPQKLIRLLLKIVAMLKLLVKLQLRSKPQSLKMLEHRLRKHVKKVMPMRRLQIKQQKNSVQLQRPRRQKHKQRAKQETKKRHSDFVVKQRPQIKMQKQLQRAQNNGLNKRIQQQSLLKTRLNRLNKWLLWPKRIKFSLVRTRKEEPAHWAVMLDRHILSRKKMTIRNYRTMLLV
jgi:hypothetical protein